ncbi:MAG: group III truncated hemoglobin, partial [Xanthomonadales bacterium]|nr:group III truncated hemoglobin [Xanthomonadales bacterium]
MPRQATISPDDISALVDCFYDKVRLDPLIGPVFNAAVHDWNAHKRLLVSFWSSLLIERGSYHGNPLMKHRGHGIENQHFERWLRLWHETSDALFDAETAGVFQEFAGRISLGMRMGLGLRDNSIGKSLGLAVR